MTGEVEEIGWSCWWERFMGVNFSSLGGQHFIVIMVVVVVMAVRGEKPKTGGLL